MNQPLKPRLFNHGDRVECNRGRGRILSYEDGRNLGPHSALRKRHNGWVYHVVLDEDEKDPNVLAPRLMIPEEGIWAEV